MNPSDRADLLDKQLTTLGPKTHKQKTEELPALIKQCRALRSAGQEQLKLEALRQAIAEGDADIKAGRTRAYQPSQLTDRAKRNLSKKGGKGSTLRQA